MAKVEAAFREEVARALKDGFTEAEVANAKSGILQKRIAEPLAGRHRGRRVGLATSTSGARAPFSKQFEDRLAALKAADVNAALRKYVDPAKLTIVKAGDFTKK